MGRAADLQGGKHQRLWSFDLGQAIFFVGGLGPASIALCSWNEALACMTQGPRREQRGQRNVPGLQVETRYHVMRRDKIRLEGMASRDESFLASVSKGIGFKDFPTKYHGFKAS